MTVIRRFELQTTGHKMIALGRFGEMKARAVYREEYLTAIGRSYRQCHYYTQTENVKKFE
jgi:hypothetical protein